MVRSGKASKNEAWFETRRVYFIVCLVTISLVTGCEEDAPPPPEPPATQPDASAGAAIDVQHMFRFKAERSILIPNMILVIQGNPAGEEIGISLTSSQPAHDGATLIFGEFVRVGAMDNLVGKEVRLRGSRLFTGMGSMIRTPQAVYKPHDAILLITSLGDGQAAGTIKGAFYRFAAPQTSITRPTELEIDASFTARLMVR